MNGTGQGEGSAGENEPDRDRSAESGKRWRRLGSTLLLDRSPWFRVFADDVELPDRHRIEDFLRIDAREHALVFAITDDGHVLLVQQYKYAPDRLTLQLPAGYLEAGESPEVGARRELLEETGYAADRWQSLGGFHLDGNRGCGVAHYFLAQGARQVQESDPGDHEDLNLVTIPFDQISGLLTSGRLADLCSVAGIGLALAALRQLDSRDPGSA